MKPSIFSSKSAKRIGTTMAALGICASLSSCWFNSAGYIFDKASYRAQSDLGELQVGSTVYQKNGSYYVELPRYKTGKGPQIMYGLGATNKKTERHQLTGMQTFRVPDYFANYLIGRGGSGDTSSLVLTPVSGSSIMNSDATYSVVRKPGSSTLNYSYSSPNAFWLYTAGVFEVLCVDIPVSATCTGLAITGVTLAVLASDNTSSSGSGYVGSYGGNSSEFNQHLNAANAGDARCQALVALCYYNGDGTARNTDMAWYYVNLALQQDSHWGYGAAAAMFADRGDYSTARNGFLKAETRARRVGNYEMANFYRRQYNKL